jgi:hypothetical protein
MEEQKQETVKEKMNNSPAVKDLQPHQQIYRDHMANFDAILEKALLNIAWDGSPPDFVDKVEGNTITFNIDKTYSLVCQAGLIEKKIDRFSTYHWIIKAAFVVNKVGRIHKESRWTRKQRRAIIRVGKAAMEGCGLAGSETYQIVNSYFVGTKAAGAEDKEIIALTKEANNPIVADPPAEKPKRAPRKKKETAQNEPSDAKPKRSRRVLPSVQEDVV